MTKDFYTSCEVYGGKILFRGIENGKRVKRRQNYLPSLFVPSKEPSKYTNIFGEYFSKVEFPSIKSAKEFVQQYDGVENFKIYGNQRYQYCYISDHFSEHIDWDKSLIRIANIDIEVGSEEGFPEVDRASDPIIAITVKMDDKYVTFGCGPYNNTTYENLTYHNCKDEYDLIMKFLIWWEQDHPDIVTGWNIQTFDIPYLVNRITKLYGNKNARRLSPWGVVNEKKVNTGYGRQSTTYDILGVATLDMIPLYRRYAKDGASQESYRLDNIAHVELGERKLSYQEYGSLHNLFKEDFEKFIDYNVKDVMLVDRIDDKHKLIDLALTLSYDNKINYEDVFFQVRMWDVICFNHFRERNQVFPPLERHEKESAYVGAYVKDPITGFHSWVASFDVTSEYPSVIMGSNISPETIVEPEDYTNNMRRIIADGVSVDGLLSQSHRLVESHKLKRLLQEDNVCLTANGQFYRRDKQGFMPALVEKMFADRKKYKNFQIEAEKAYEVETDLSKKNQLRNDIAKFNNLQLSKKVSLNSLYGALGSQYFRFFDLRNAIAVTTTGQLSIRWIQKTVNNYLNRVLRTEGEDYVIAVDTDSLYLALAELVKKSNGESNNVEQTITFMDKVCKVGIQPVIDEACDEVGRYLNVFQQKIFMKRESLCDKVIWTAKKRYILNVWDSEGVRYAKPKKKTMGLELKKSSTPTYCRDKLTEAVNLIFDADERTIQEFVKQVKEDFNKQPLADISFPRGLNEIVKWSDKDTIYGSGTPIHVRGALIYNHFIRQHKLTGKYPLIQTGEKLKFIYLKEPNILQSNVISFPQGGLPQEFIDEGVLIDYNTQFNKAFLEPLKIITDAIGWKAEKTSSLMDFFGKK